MTTIIMIMIERIGNASLLYETKKKRKRKLEKRKEKKMRNKKKRKKTFV